MANIQRLVKNICNHNIESLKVFSSIARKSDTSVDRLSANTPIPNQVFATSYNELGNFTKVIFLERASRNLENIREIDHLCTAHRSSMGKKPITIKFVCLGYKDFDGDIVITDIECPIIESAYEKKFKNNEKFLDYISKESTSADFNREAPARMYDYLRTMGFNQPAIGTDVVALLGVTKQETTPEYNNCFRLSEIAEAVVPNLPVKADNIMSGVLAITPKTVKAKALFDKKGFLNVDDYLEPGSLECAIISYKKSHSAGVVIPTNIQDIKSAVKIQKGKEYTLKISSSSQPTDGLYTARQQKLNYEKYM